MRPAQACGVPLPVDSALPTTLLEGIRRRLDQAPEARLWTVDGQGGVVCTRYADLWTRAVRIRAGLVGAGILPGRVLVGALLQASDCVAAFWAALMGGYAFMPASGRVRRAIREQDVVSLHNLLSKLPGFHVLTDAASAELGAALDRQGNLRIDILAKAGGAPWLAALPAPSPGVYLPTSGSTGRDKLACFDEVTLLRRRFLRDNPAGPAHEGVLWVFEPDSVTGFNTVFVGATEWALLSPEQVLARPAAVLDVLQASGAARLAVTSSLARRVTEAAEAGGNWRIPNLKRISMGGEPVDAAVARRLRQALAGLGATQVKLMAGYGTTESGSLTAGHEVSDEDATSTPVCLGKPAAGVCLRVVDADGVVVTEGQEGSVEAHCPGLFFSGYAGETSATDHPDADGWWRTGDRGWLREECLYLHGRDKELLIVRGRKLALADIDARMATVVKDTHLALACVLADTAGEALGVIVFGEPSPALARALRGALGQGLGVQPGKLVFADSNELPLAAGGKVHRLRLASLLAEKPEVAFDSPVNSTETTLESLWRECLPPGARAEAEAHFFEEGGDSLALQALFAGLETHLDVTLEPAAFFADPTLRHLTRLVRGIEPVARAPSVQQWPLPDELHRQLLAELAVWPGTRPTEDGLMAGFNVEGTRPPLFWIFQAPQEAAALADALGPDQPLYAFRSGHSVFPYDDDTLQAVALRYAQDVLAVCPAGPLFVGGNCQGGRVAFVLASVLLARKIPVPLLILVEWGFELAHYGGEVLFLYGQESLEGNPWLRHAAPELAWQRYLRRWDTQVIAGQHTHYFLPTNVPALAYVLQQRLTAAASKPPDTVARCARHAVVSLGPLPEHLVPGQDFTVTAEVRNASAVSWSEGLSLGNYWVDPRGHFDKWRDGRVFLPVLGPDESASCTLEMQAPTEAGIWTLVVDVVEEGGVWFDRALRTAPSVRIAVR